jgi:signal transduction histidine kinase
MERPNTMRELISEMLEGDDRRSPIEASRLEGGFIAELAHEMRTPLNSVIGFASLIGSAKAGPVSEQQKEFLGHILTSARHMLQLINDVLDLARFQAGKMHLDVEPVALATAVGEICDTMRTSAAEKRVTLSVVVDPSMETAILDRTRLRQVLLNYLSNAIKFTRACGRIEVRVAPEPGDAIRIEVEDSGIGIAETDLPRLFVDFQRIDAAPTYAAKGAGLGLALTKRIIEAQGGSVGVRSIPGIGSTFWAILPKAAAASQSGLQIA